MQYKTNLSNAEIIDVNFNRPLMKGDIISVPNVDVSGYVYPTIYKVIDTLGPDEVELQPIFPIPVKIVGFLTSKPK